MNSHWPGKYIIGLTGNIATGKSVVRKMLEHLGAYGIDADALSHRATARGAPGYAVTVETFGKWIVGPDGEIDRARLGRLAFGDPAVMAQLEAIIHPLVSQAIEVMVKRASQKVIVIEAIKLLETELFQVCDSIWVVDGPEELQIQRLMSRRGLRREEAVQRIRFQGGQRQKLAAAQVVIRNSGSFEQTWQNVLVEWKKINPQAETLTALPKPAAGTLSVVRGRPRDSAAIAGLVTRLSNGAKTMTQDDVMAAFGEKAFMLLLMGGTQVGVAGWQVENLVARTTDFFIDPAVPLEQGLKILLSEVERASEDLQCEASLLFLPPNLAALPETWKQLGYEPRQPQTLGVQAWADAALESTQPNTKLFFKQLRVDRVLRPI